MMAIHITILAKLTPPPIHDTVVDGVKKAVRPITDSLTASSADIDNLKQVCRFLIFSINVLAQPHPY